MQNYVLHLLQKETLEMIWRAILEKSNEFEQPHTDQSLFRIGIFKVLNSFSSQINDIASRHSII